MAPGHKQRCGGGTMPAALVPRRSCCSQLACTAVDSRGRNHRRRCRIDDVVIEMVIWGRRYANLRLILLCARKMEKRTLRANACHCRRNCWPHVGLVRVIPSVRFMKGNGTKNDSRPVRYLLLHWHVLLLLERPGNDVGLVNFHLSDLVMGRVAPRAAFAADGVLVPSFPNGLLERAAGVG